MPRADSQIAKLVHLIMETDNASVIRTYDTQIAALEEEKIGLKEMAIKAVQPRTSFEQSFRTAWSFLSNPWKFWASGRLDYQRLVLTLAFSRPLAYCRNEGLRSAAIAEPLRDLGMFAASNVRMVELSEESSNRIFETLADWEEQLKPYRDELDFDPPEFELGGLEP